MQGVELKTMKSGWDQQFEDLSWIEELQVAIVGERNPIFVCLEVSTILSGAMMFH